MLLAFLFLSLLFVFLLLLLKLVAATFTPITWTEAFNPKRQGLFDLYGFAHLYILHPLTSCSQGKEMVLTRIEVEQLQVVHGENHRALRLIHCAPFFVTDVIGALKVVAHAQRTDGYGCIVGQQQHLLALGKEFYCASDDGRVGKRGMMALRTDAFDTEAVLLLLKQHEPFGQACCHVQTEGGILPVGQLIICGLLHGRKAIDLFVGFAHDHELATNLLAHLGNEFQLTFEHQSCVDTRVGMARSVTDKKLQPDVGVRKYDVVIEHVRDDGLEDEVSLECLFIGELLYLLVTEQRNITA